METISETIRYRSAVVSYVDILGFKDLVDRSRTDETLVKQISETLQSVRSELSVKPSAESLRRQGVVAKDFKAENFSDLTVRCRFVVDSDYREKAIAELLFLADTQTSLALQGVLIRGGVCRGDIRFEQGVVFGPGLVKSYLLESQFAVFPRIVIDRDLVFALRSSAEHRELFEPIVRGEDGAFFLDYLASSVAPDLCVDEWRDACAVLEKHRQFVLSQIGDEILNKPERVKQKIAWLGLYHNRAIDRLAAHDHIAHREAELLRLRLDEDFLRF